MKDKYKILREELLNIIYQIHVTRNLDERIDLEDKRKQIQKEMKLYLLEENKHKRK